MKAKMTMWLWVGLGGALGTLARIGVSEFFNTTSFPTGTLIVNLVGSLLLGGFTAYLYIRKNNTLHLLFGVGFCGSFTTTSMFAADATLLLSNSIGQFFGYILGSVIGGVFLALLGFGVIKNIYGRGQTT